MFRNGEVAPSQGRMWAVAAAGVMLLGTMSRLAADAKVAFVDLQPYANHKLAENFHREEPAGNNLAEFSQGDQTLEGIRFRVGEGLVQLGSTMVEGKPEKVEGIRVGRKAAALHFLHGTGYGGGPEDSEYFVADGTVIGQYQVEYEDKSSAVIPIIYGEDVRDWWVGQGAKEEVSRGKIAWKGENQAAKQNNAGLRLYSVTWKNPNPEKKVETILFSSAKTRSAPFLLALSAEE